MGQLTTRSWMNGSGLAISAATLTQLEGDLARMDTIGTGATGTFSAIPTATAANVGQLYLATDVNGGTLYQSTGAAWTQVAAGVTQAGGQELSQAQLATDFALTNTVANTPTIITGLSQTFAAPGGRLRFAMNIGSIMLTANAGIWRFKIWDGTVGSGTLLCSYAMLVNANAILPPCSVAVPVTLSAGSHTINTSYESDTIGVNGSIWGASLFPATVDVFKP